MPEAPLLCSEDEESDDHDAFLQFTPFQPESNISFDYEELSGPERDVDIVGIIFFFFFDSLLTNAVNSGLILGLRMPLQQAHSHE